MNGMNRKLTIGLIVLLSVLVIGIPLSLIGKTLTDSRQEAEITATEPAAPVTTATAPAAREETDWLGETGCRLSAHRGCTPSVPENTLEGIQKVNELGFGALEIDPRRSADGTFFLMHDDSVSRTTDGSGHISSMTDAQIKSLHILTASYPEYSGAEIKVPTLDEALSLISQTDMVLNIDCSKGACDTEESTEQLVSLLKQHNMYERSFLVLSNASARARVHEAYPNLCLSWLYDPSSSLSSNIEEVKQYPRAMLSIKEESMSDSMLTQLLDSGIYFQVYNVNSDDTAERLKNAGVPMAETDRVLP